MSAGSARGLGVVSNATVRRGATRGRQGARPGVGTRAVDRLALLRSAGAVAIGWRCCVRARSRLALEVRGSPATGETAETPTAPARARASAAEPLARFRGGEEARASPATSSLGDRGQL